MAGDQLPTLGAAALDRALVPGGDFGQARGDQGVDGFRSLLAFRVETQERGEGLAGLAKTDRIAGQGYKRPVATDEGLGRIEQGEALAQDIESGDQDVFR